MCGREHPGWIDQRTAAGLVSSVEQNAHDRVAILLRELTCSLPGIEQGALLFFGADSKLRDAAERLVETIDDEGTVEGLASAAQSDPLIWDVGFNGRCIRVSGRHALGTRALRAWNPCQQQVEPFTLGEPCPVFLRIIASEESLLIAIARICQCLLQQELDIRLRLPSLRGVYSRCRWSS
jgi:hypothetical protein